MKRKNSGFFFVQIQATPSVVICDPPVSHLPLPWTNRLPRLARLDCLHSQDSRDSICQASKDCCQRRKDSCQGILSACQWQLPTPVRLCCLVCKIRAKDKFRLPIAEIGIHFNSESDCLGFASNINFGCIGIRFVLLTVAKVTVGSVLFRWN